MEPFVDHSNQLWAWDSQSLGLLKECPRKFYLTQILGYRPKGESIHLAFGAHVASSMEYFFKARQTLSYEEALEATIGEALRITQNMPVDDTGKKTRENLVRTLVWYFDRYKDDKCEIVLLEGGVPAVELTFKLPVDFTINGQEYLYCGHLDRLVTFNTDIYVMDQKTTGGTLGPYYFTQFAPDNQMSGYSLASKIIFKSPVKGVIIDAMQIAVGFSAFGRSITTRTDEQLVEWMTDFKTWATLEFQFAEQNNWPMNDKSCHKYGGCPFRPVCSKDPRVRQTFLNTDFEIRRWNPLDER